ncbi:hypothetical protein A5652_00930 [Mycobacterium sp. 1165178.9]|nr:hypothetical protein A5652_00930 [Mycobacterium sp. 1165178.9]
MATLLAEGGEAGSAAWAAEPGSTGPGTTEPRTTKARTRTTETTEESMRHGNFPFSDHQFP